ncbi:hypothetical protein MBUL_04445 (plasmid) [Methylobacterium bullatum]|uniref:Uncharacterized protein n=1 Tax=Methylobacterium bullatum TaxID=570505 RepID=A0A679JIE0_9HYPH|nr:hypothetical protein MBUL_04445 [Methylobacterium bullatum]
MGSLFNTSFGQGDPRKLLKASNGPSLEATLRQAAAPGYDATRGALGSGSELNDASLERAKAARALLDLNEKGRR